MADFFQEHFKGQAVMQIFGRMDFVSHIHAFAIKCIKDRKPAFRQLVKAVLDQPFRPLRIGVEVGPEQRTAEGYMPIKPEPARGFRGHEQLIDRPFLPLGRIAANLGRGEGVGWKVEGRMKGNQLALQMAG